MTTETIGIRHVDFVSSEALIVEFSDGRLVLFNAEFLYRHSEEDGYEVLGDEDGSFELTASDSRVQHTGRAEPIWKLKIQDEQNPN